MLQFALSLAVLLLPASAVWAGVDPAALCKAKKLAASGKYYLGLTKAFGNNQKTPNASKLTSDLSKAQSKITKAFTKAEFAASGAPNGCATTGDVGCAKTAVDGQVAAILPLTCPSTTVTTTTTTTSTTLPATVCCDTGPACFGGFTVGACVGGGGTVGGPGTVCDMTANCVTPPGSSTDCCSLAGQCAAPRASGDCTLAGGLYSFGVCQPDGTCQ